MSEALVVKRLANGLTLAIEPMRSLRSAAMTLTVPAGVASDPDGAVGCATVLSEMTLRGAGTRSSRELTDHLDQLGLQRTANVGIYQTRYSAAGISKCLLQALPAYADVIRRPMLLESDFESSRELAMQALQSLDDDPRSQAMVQLRQLHWPDPLGRNPMGTLADLEKLDHATTRREHARRFVAEGAILAMAGDVEPARVIEEVERHFGSWNGSVEPPRVMPDRSPGAHFIEQQTEQTHIGLAWPTVGDDHPDYYVMRVIGEMLGGASSSRLFTEVRERRGLCYSVGTSYASLRDRASMLAYAGTTTERAQETLDQIVIELNRVAEGFTKAEVDRARIGLKASTLTSAESTSTRSAMLASDVFTFGKPRRLEEIAAALDAVTLDRVNDFAATRRPENFTVVTLGPKPLDVGKV